MKLHRTLLATLLVLAAFGPGPAAAGPAATGPSAKVEVFATGLIYPRGLEFGPDGHPTAAV